MILSFLITYFTAENLISIPLKIQIFKVQARGNNGIEKPLEIPSFCQTQKETHCLLKDPG